MDQAHAEIDSTLDGANAAAYVAPDGARIGVGAAGGHPQIVVPIGYPGGDRMGAALLGRRWSEPSLLALAGALEDATHARVPPTQVEGGATPSGCPQRRSSASRARSSWRRHDERTHAYSRSSASLARSSWRSAA